MVYFTVLVSQEQANKNCLKELHQYIVQSPVEKKKEGLGKAEKQYRKMDMDSKPPAKGPKNKQRTIQVKIGGQAAKTMTPDQAADYLKQIAGKGAFGTSREMKLVSA